MVDATLARSGTSVTLPLLAPGGTPLVARDIGKPHLEIQNSGRLNPRHVDHWSGLEQYTLLGRFHGANAYSDAIDLANLIKSHSGGSNLTLNIGLDEYDSGMKVAPAAGQQEAVTMVYNSGTRDWVEVDLALTRIDQTIADGSQDASTPTTSGSGPIQLVGARNTVDVDVDVTVTHSVGRPNSVVRRSQATHPRFIDHRKAAYDAFELSFEFTNNTVSKINDIVDMFQTKLGRGALTLDFNGLYGMGAVDVVPDGSAALRHVRPSGTEGTSPIPTVKLRRVFQ